MNSRVVNLPVYAKFSLITMGVVAFFYILYQGQDIIIPLIFSAIIAILLNPLVNFMVKKNVNRVMAIFFALIAGMLLVALLFYFIGSQISMFSESFPQFQEKFTDMYDDAIKWITRSFNLSNSKFRKWLENLKGDGLENAPAIIGQTLGTVGGILILVFLIPVYVFMFLFYKPLLLEFIYRVFKSKLAMVEEVLNETKMLVQSYLSGLLIEAVAVASLNAVALLIIGIDYAVLIGIIGALLNIIPYVGGLIAISIPMLIAIATKSPIDAFWVFVAYIIVQFIDNNFLLPKIVASKVKVNALVSIIVVLIGGALWGISGMFLSIPITAIIKVILDRIEPLKPFGFLLGDNQPDIGKTIFKAPRGLKRKKE
jgi:predicted PurR-regulated permease PerM